MSNEQSNTTDDRWGGYVPWFLRHQGFSSTGDFLLFFKRLSQRLEVFFKYESGIPNLHYFVEKLESESLQRFQSSKTETHQKSIHHQIPRYFNPDTIISDFELKVKISGAFTKALQGKDAKSIISDQLHYNGIVIERMGVLESLLRILPSPITDKLKPATSRQELYRQALPIPSPQSVTDKLKQDIRKLFVEAKIMLDIKGEPPLIVPMDEPLLQREVIDKLLPRLEAQFPEREKEFVKAYHDLIGGRKLDEVFLEAFKTLEEIARSLTKDTSFEFDPKNLKKYFPKLHGAIHESIKRLAGHRGDKASHGKSAPEPYEIRYLLFTICNVALLLLDYPSSNTARTANEVTSHEKDHPRNL